MMTNKLIISDFCSRLIPYIDPRITLGEFLTIIILFLTLVVTFFYAYITFGLWKQSIRNTNLQVTPLLVVLYEFRKDKYENKRKVFILKNIGKGPAFNIKIEDFILHIFDDWVSNKVKHCKLEFERINYLDIGAETELKMCGFEDGETLSDNGTNFISAMLSPYSQKSIPMSIIYSNSLGQNLFSTIVFGKDSFKIRKISEHITLKYYIFSILNNISGRLNSFFFRFRCKKGRNKK